MHRELRTSIVGIRFCKDAARLLWTLKPGRILDIVPVSDDPKKPSGLGVFYRDHQVGYIAKAVAPDVRRILFADYPFSCRLSRVNSPEIHIRWIEPDAPECWEEMDVVPEVVDYTKLNGNLFGGLYFYDDPDAILDDDPEQE